MTQCLDEGAADSAGRGHVAWRGALKNNLLLPAAHFPGRTVRQQNDFGGHSFGKPQKIGCLSPRGLQSNAIPEDQRTRYGVRGRGNRSQNRVPHRIIVKAAGKLPDGAGLFVPFEGGSHAITAAEPLKMLGRKNKSSPVAMNPFQQPKINGLRVFIHCLFDTKHTLFWCQN